MRIAILDDSQQDIEKLKELLSDYFAAANMLAEYKAFQSSAAFLAAFEPKSYSVVFLDIYMDGPDGMEVAKEIFSKDPQCRLIFSTVSQSHAVASYGVRASYYLTKPLDYPTLCDALNQICEDFTHESRYLNVSIGMIDTTVLLQDVLYVDCSAQRTRIHLLDKSLAVDNKASDVFSQLSHDNRFLSCNRNVAVNMDYIETVRDNDFLLQNGAAIPIRQRGKKALRKIFLEYSVRDLQRRI